MSKRGIARLIVAGLYLGAIPGFAAIYTYQLPGQFYHSTLMRESVIGEKRRIIERDLYQIVYKQWNETPTAHHVRSRVPRVSKEKSWLIDLNRVESIIVSQNTVSFTVSAEVLRGDSQPQSNIDFGISGVQIVNLGATLNLENVRQSSAFYNEIPLTFTILPDAAKVFIDIPAQLELENALFPQHNAAGSSILNVPTPTLDTIKDYSAANEGIDLERSENYPRMFYFSATTLTTLGLGDIVPMTPRARGWVSVEAIVGVVLIGLFLNLLGSKNAKDT